MAQSDSSLRGSPSSSSTDGVVNSISDQLEVGPGVAAVIAIICGLIMNTCGYKLLRPTMFACGFLVGGYIVSSLAEYIVHGRTAFWIAYLIGGTIVGSLTVSIYSAGIFIIGAAGGVFLATIINTSVGYRIYPSDPSTGLLIMAIVLGLICGIVAFKVERLAIIVATALVGAVMLVNGVGYYSGKFPKLTGTKDYRHLDEDGYYVYDVPKEWWGYLAAILVVSIFGFFVQIKKTGTK
ncbi:hypothetical protein KXD40_008466 [Peronospora effusa]|uniref:Transmembrane protein 198 n=1 Tax=Peronospora effusa TaxID=542832 RepID=A0A3M6V9F9_9STRA|nr:hypothetical protein DD238_007607 [Peronospora effusa]RQM13096.1 hypothetical protein DD237_002933 [Peronospora effusa]UIZ24509.1 hypothetical protein KXD40_008466 [Peronospora effusa]CAI5700971.1 unnamed protein product [Peronospora effusa]